MTSTFFNGCARWRKSPWKRAQQLNCQTAIRRLSLLFSLISGKFNQVILVSKITQIVHTSVPDTFFHVNDTFYFIEMV